MEIFRDNTFTILQPKDITIPRKKIIKEFTNMGCVAEGLRA